MDKIGTVLILLGFMFEDPKHLFISRKKKSYRRKGRLLWVLNASLSNVIDNSMLIQEKKILKKIVIF